MNLVPLHSSRLRACLSLAACCSFVAGCGGDTVSFTLGPPAAESPGIYLVAGDIGGPGSADGTGNAAHFNTPGGIAVDAAGNFFIADTANSTIRRITPGGAVTTAAGKAGESGTADGTAAAARFNRPKGIAVDRAGNLYVADTDSHTIRRIDASGNVTTLAGLAGAEGRADGTGNAARFCRPNSMAADSKGNVFVLEECNYAIRKITPGGIVSTFAGVMDAQAFEDGTGINARFRTPKRITIDMSDNLYLTDDVTLRKITPAAEVKTIAGVAGRPGDGDGQDGRFNLQTYGVAADAAGNVYVYDEGRVRKVSPTGYVSSVVRNPPPALGVYARPSMVVGADGNLYISNGSRHTIHRVSPEGVVSDFAGGHGRAVQRADGTGTAARFGQIYGLAADRNGDAIVLDASVFLSAFMSDLYGLDDSGFALRKLGKDGAVSTIASPAMQAPFFMASDVSGDLYFITWEYYVTETTRRGQDAVYRLALSTGELKMLASRTSGFGLPTAGQLYFQPGALAVDSSKNVYVGSRSAILKITTTGELSLHAGSAESSGNRDGIGADARFGNITAMAIDSANNLYVADDSAIRKVAPDGSVRTLAGVAGQAGSLDGKGAEARFSAPSAMAFDPGGNLYIADLDRTIRRLASDGTVTTVAGSRGWIGTVLGSLPGAIDAPTGIRFLEPNILMVSTMNSILKIVLP